MYKELEQQVNQAVKTNNQKANKQINDLQARREAFEEGMETALILAGQIALEEADKSCPCCQGDEPVAESDDVDMYVDEKGNFCAYNAERTIIAGRFMYCPICGRKFESK